ncbi:MULTISPECIES: hypothetical protein [unclassified Agrococcus]|uniref:hypothetical protein n=1 Tax=unclassified Agrococcus TaxID=2615065 RepID=UPI003615AA19
MPETPHPLLSRLVGMRLASVQFVLNDYVRLHFESNALDGEMPILDCFAWPRIEVRGRVWAEADAGYGDVMRRLAPGDVLEVVEVPGHGMRIVLDTGALIIDPRLDEVVVEIALLNMGDGGWGVWRPGDHPFAHLR